MALDEQSKALLEMLTKGDVGDALGLAPYHVDFVSVSATARENLKQIALALARPSLKVGEFRDQRIPSTDGEVPIRLYWPEGKSDDRAAMVYVHGGGWVIGDLDTHDSIMRELCVLTDMVICNVGYRLAPEHKFPAGLDDVCAAVRWLSEQASGLGVDPDRIGIAGESAGGNIAAAAALRARESEGMRLAAQFLLFPNLCALAEFTTPSRENVGDDCAHYPSKDQIEAVIRHYTRTEKDRRNPLVSPLLAEDLSGSPPAVIITAGYDPFRDEGRMYAERLEAAGVPTQHTCYESTIHGFINYGNALDIAEEAIEDLAYRAKALLNA